MPKYWGKHIFRKKKVGENNGQLRFRLPPWVAHASRLDKTKSIVFTYLCFV